MITRLGGHQAEVDATLAQLTASRVVPRLWEHDHTLWKPEPAEITNRLGWLHLPETMRVHVKDIQTLVKAVAEEGYTHALLLGMGGSSLAPEVFSTTFATPAPGRLALSVLDSTDPGAVWAADAAHDPRKTLYIVSTKSGGTVETFSFLAYFYSRVAEAVGAAEAGRHFIAITDPGSKLEKVASQYGFRFAFLNDPEIGGRFSALSLFGLVPAALVGVDVTRLLDAGAAMAQACRIPAAGDNPGLRLGVILGVLARAGRDKLTIVASDEIAHVVDWIEQLVAESTGKEGVGILPVVWEALGAPEVYGDDRLFVSLDFDGDSNRDAALAALADAGHPVVRLPLAQRYDLGEQFMLWEVATAVASHLLRINPFDQPNVEAAKVLARQAVAAYAETGRLPAVPADSPSAETLRAFLAGAKPGDYLCLQAYVKPTPETTAALDALRLAVRDRAHLATAAGYGPRFLHSTGQLHKGDGGNGLFVQFVSSVDRDVAIPDEPGSTSSKLSFGTLIAAQAAGDRQALLDNQRRVLRFDLGSDVAGGLKRLLD